MNAWLHLLKKEFRLGLTAFLVPIITYLVLTGVAAYIGSRNGFSWEAVVGVSIFAIGLQVFYVLYYLLNSLQVERKKLHLWIHTPMPGYGLLSAKIAAGLISMIMTLLLTGVTLMVAVHQSPTISEQVKMVQLADMSLLGGIHLILFAVSLAVLFIFFWIVFLLFNRNLGSFVSFLSTFVLFIGTTSVYNWFKESIVYEKLTSWGEIQFSGIAESVSIEASMESGTEVITEVGTFSLFAGAYLFETVVALILFFAACWMLDHKVEV
ncbi:hypothetical protein [Halalkalibacter alkalisediminis]|uniref:ABC transporter permease n=1 Tax=Halalkalibacter alkalisediminis TaxID=935616 RepID=A0ABV6NFI3_9BACI|nr:hypothetical protein [Halalkalibacter alkalisediminis]